MEYVLYQSQLHQINHQQMYAGVPNFYLSHGKMGSMLIGTNALLDDSRKFKDVLSARGHAQCNGLKNYRTINVEDATRLVKLYNDAKETRTSEYKITGKEIDVLKRLESVSTEIPFIWGN